MRDRFIKDIGEPAKNHAFSITPALSRWEREKRSQRLGLVGTASCFMACEIYEDVQRLFLLPEGEGQDEGETRHEPDRLVTNLN